VSNLDLAVGNLYQGGNVSHYSFMREVFAGNWNRNCFNMC
jgi:hypothetical protein